MFPKEISRFELPLPQISNYIYKEPLIQLKQITVMKLKNVNTIHVLNKISLLAISVTLTMKLHTQHFHNNFTTILRCQAMNGK